MIKQRLNSGTRGALPSPTQLPKISQTILAKHTRGAQPLRIKNDFDTGILKLIRLDPVGPPRLFIVQPSHLSQSSLILA